MSLFFSSPKTWSASILLLQESLRKSLMALEGLRPDVEDEQLQPVPVSWWELKRGLSAASPAWDPSWCQDCSGRALLSNSCLTQEGDGGEQIEAAEGRTLGRTWSALYPALTAVGRSAPSWSGKGIMYTLEQRVCLEPTSESPGGPHSRISDSLGLGWDLGMGISNIPDDTDVAGQVLHFETRWLWGSLNWAIGLRIGVDIWVRLWNSQRKWQHE